MFKIIANLFNDGVCGRFAKIANRNQKVLKLLRCTMTLIIMVLVLFVFVGCAEKITTTKITTQNNTAESSIATVALPTNESDSALSANATSEVLSCTASADCQEWEMCIDGACGKIADLYNTTCENKCNFKELTFSTSDGETYTLKPGQGSYTAVGALEWRVYTVPAYCPQEDIVIPIHLLMKNYGDIVAEKVITLQEGQTSEELTHPQIPSISFTVKLERVEEECS